MPHSVPVPVGAHWLAGNNLQVVWDRRLEAGATAGVNWTARHGNVAWNALVPGTMAGNTTTVPMNAVAADVGPDVCHYAATPADVVSDKGVPAAPFTDFPIT